MRSFIASAALLVATALPVAADQTLKGVADDTYQLDRTHAFLTWTVVHGGISEYTASFTDFDATLDFDPDEPTDAVLTVTINPMGIQTNYPDETKRAEWHQELSTDAKFFQANKFPEIEFVSTDIEKTGSFTGTVTGDLTFLGVTKSVTLVVTYHGTTNAPWYGPRDLIGFSATTTLNRSDFGMTSLTNLVSDEVVVEFSGEFLQNE